MKIFTLRVTLHEARRCAGFVLAVMAIWLMSCNLSSRDSNAAAQASAVIFGRVLSSPGMATQPMPKPIGVPGRVVTLAPAAGGALIATATSASDGSYRFTVPPGDYSVSGVGNPHLVHVDPGQQLEVNLFLLNP
jgi:hypothetical protein